MELVPEGAAKETQGEEKQWVWGGTALCAWEKIKDEFIHKTETIWELYE